MGFFIPPARPPGGGPSEAQLKYAKHLATSHKLTIPAQAIKTSKGLSQWIGTMLAKQPS